VATGGYALRAYDRWQKLQRRPDGLWQLRDPRSAQRIRMNIGTILDTDTLKVRLKGRGGAPLGEVEESFAATLTAGDTFLIGGQVVRYEGLREMTVEVTRRADKPPKIAAFMGTKFATSTQLSSRILRMFRQPEWPALPSHTADWLALQRRVSKLPEADRILVETFPHEGREHVCIYGFAGRNAMQTLGLLVTRQMEERGLAPIGFVASDYAVLIWSLDRMADPAQYFEAEGLRAAFDTWLGGNAVLKRTFRGTATIAGLIDRKIGGQKKTGRQATFSSDILYDTLLKYDPDHLLLQITREEAMRGLVDFGRIEEMLERTGGRIDHVDLGRVTPLSAPLFLEVGKVSVAGQAGERMLADAAARLIELAGIEPGTTAP
jgi:ATP-dependent Lhr-like helicase